MKLDITKKSEAWKFSPLQKINGFDVSINSLADLNTVKNIKVALGPSEQQIHTVLLQDLVESGVIKISMERRAKYFYDDHNTTRAKLDRNLERLSTSDETVVIEFLKSPQSILWVDPNTLGTNIKFKTQSAQEVRLVFFETQTTQDQALSPKLANINFDVSNSSTLELGISLSNDQSSFSLINVKLGNQAHFNSYALMCGTAEYKRLEVNVFQQGSDSTAVLNGLNAVKNQSSFDYHSNVFHLNKNQRTSQNFKSVCKEKSKSIFTGRVHLTENCSGAAVDQINNNLLLGKTSSVDTQPELNIFQDNVKATHGATTSSLDEDHIFYFSSRGFHPDQAQKILLDAFCSSTCENLKTLGVKDFFKAAIAKELYDSTI